MKNSKQRLLLIPLLAFSLAKAQTPVLNTPPSLPVADFSDCSKAHWLDLKRFVIYTCDAAANAGQKQEAKTSDKSAFVFEKEHQATWYAFKAKYKGRISLDIVPQDSTNDYDFIIYKGDSLHFCENVAAGKVKPIRSNLSRTSEAVQGKTGLSVLADREYVGPGPGDSYSAALSVEAGDFYLWVLDNVYPKGKGHTLYINYLKDLEITGTAKGTDSSLIKTAEMNVIDQFGKVVYHQETTDGKFSQKATLKENQTYTVNVESEGYFFESRNISTNQIKPGAKKGEPVRITIQTVLPKLKAGGRYSINTINFYPNSAEVLPASLPSMKALYKILVKNPGLRIEIGGHVNGCTSPPGTDIQKLSEERAATVMKYCVDKNIAASRMVSVGYGCKGMRFPNAMTEYEMMMNRRVEINVLDFKQETQ